jgi:hypothetical protein
MIKGKNCRGLRMRKFMFILRATTCNQKHLLLPILMNQSRTDSLCIYALAPIEVLLCTSPHTLSCVCWTCVTFFARLDSPSQSVVLHVQLCTVLIHCTDCGTTLGRASFLNACIIIFHASFGTYFRSMASSTQAWQACARGTHVLSSWRWGPVLCPNCNESHYT